MSENKENILILGLGAIGAVSGLMLHNSGKARLSTVARSNHAIVQAEGIIVDSKPFNSKTVLKFEHVYSSSDVPTTLPEPFDYIVVSTKALPLAEPSLVTSLEPFVQEGKSVIVLIQNGVGIEDGVRARWPNNGIITCVAWMGVTQTSLGTVSHYGAKGATIGPYFTPETTTGTLPTPEQKERVDKFASMLREGGGDITIKYDHVLMQAERWKKVAWNAAWNALTTLVDLDTATLLSSSPFAEPITRRLMMEIGQVAHALNIHIRKDKETGVTLDDDLVAKARSVGTMTSSMRVDMLNQRAMEVEVIMGIPLRHAKRLGVDTPVLETVYALVSAIDGKIAGRIKALV